jgi:hypothetical protein
MAKESGLGQAAYFAGFDVSGDVGSWNCANPRVDLDMTAINKSARERILAHGNGQASLSSFFNKAAAAAHLAFSPLPTTDVHLMICTGTTAGDPTMMLEAKQIGYDGSRTADGGFIFDIETLSTDFPLEWGRLVCTKTTHASASSTSTWDSGAASAQGGVAQLQAFSCSPGDPVTYILQDNVADNGAWATYITFGAIAAASHPITSRVEETDNCERYRRVTTTGTFTNAIFAVAMRDGLAEDDVAYSG